MALVACTECGKDISTEAQACPHCGKKRQTPGFWSKAIGPVALLVGLFWLGHILTSGPIAGLGTGNASSAAIPTCSPRNVTLNKTTVNTRGDYATLTGIVRHNCPGSTGLKLKWTAYNSDGSVAFSQEFWPASTNNIPANTDFPFQFMNQAPRGQWTYIVVPAEVHAWGG